MHDLERAIVKAKSQRAVRLYPVEAATCHFIAAGMDRQPGADSMGASQPRLRKERRLAAPPESEQPIEAFRENWSEFVRRDLRRKRRAWPIRQIGRRGEINPKADDHAVAAALQQDSGELFAQQKQVVGPFQHQRLARHGEVDRFDQRKTGRERQGLRLRIVGAEVDDRASVEIAARRNPAAPLPSLPRLLLERDQPFALARRRIGDQVGVRRSGALDEADSGQNRVPAARSLSAPSGPMRR